MCSVIPTDGFGTIMGRSFKRWRTTGSVKYSVQFFGAKNVDEIFYLWFAPVLEEELSLKTSLGNH